MIRNIATDLKIVQVLVPAAPSGSATTSDYICCKNLHKVVFIFSLYDGNTQDTVFSLYESTAVDTTGAASAKTHKIWTNADISASDLLVRETDAATYTLVNSAGTKTKLVVIEWDPAKHTAGYDCIAIYQDATNASNISSCIAICIPRYAGANGVDSIAD